ncbi:hypothetical protein ACN4EE_01225 [Geminocystis sp. CENA526]|uniref:hypothetical protein n=1 Tax=Geminocystis sp. CENA526 TaxID=1355871 RepID=UPI003D6EF7C8
MSKKQQVFNLLSDGFLHNAHELAQISYRFGDIIHKLRKEDYKIKTIKVAHNTFMYQMVMKQS